VGLWPHLFLCFVDILTFLSPLPVFDIWSYDRPLIMGIINVTPDSFSDGGLFVSADRALSHASRLLEEGADLLDVGGESTRPGSMSVSVDEELRRIMPVVDALVRRNVKVSVDTSKPEVMRAVIRAGAAMINDVNALRAEGALETVASGGVAVCLMHMRGEPRSMQVEPHYYDVVKEVKDFLRQRLNAARAWGIPDERLVVDPGFGFGKTLEHNIELLRHFDQFVDLGVPLLAGLSRKSMLGKITGNDVSDRVHASVAAAVLAVAKGARILRVHDVKATREAVAVYNAISN
jgi:dihydropteroate synthase